MKTLYVITVAVLLIALMPHPHVRAQDSHTFGVVVSDITANSECLITSRTYAELDIESQVIDEQTTGCPAGSVIRVSPVSSESEAQELGGYFVPLTGNPETDAKAIRAAKLPLMPVDSSYGLNQQAALGCSDRSFSKTLQYRAYQPSVMVYTTVYYWQDFACTSGVSRAKAWLSWDANLWWRQMVYTPPYWFDYHGCPNLSTGATWDTYNKRMSLGGTYEDESINEGGTVGCRNGYGESYSNYMVL